MKQGTNITLPVEFNGLNLATVEKIEFIFKQTASKTSPVLKSALWVNGNENETAYKPTGIDAIYVPFTKAETYLFKANATFYLDTRVHIQNSTDNPYTAVLPIQMTSTLFNSDEVITG